MSTRGRRTPIGMALAVAICLALCACTQAAGQQELAWFSGHTDIAAGRLIIDEITVLGPEGELAAIDTVTAGIETRTWNPNIPIDPPNGVIGSCVNNLGVELATVPGTVGTGLAGCGRENSFCGDVQMYSCYTDSSLRGAFVELTWISSSANNGFGAYPRDAAAAKELKLDGALGLWSYGNPDNSAVRTWKFDNFGGTDFRFRGVVKGDVTNGAMENDCENSLDDDEDGATDCADPDCSEALNCRGKVELCGDGYDNDEDGPADCADTDCAGDVACPAPEGLHCADILAKGGSRGDGVYTIDPDGAGARASMLAYCDMTTDGGGWTLLLNYLHQGGTNPELDVRTANLPLIGSSTLGTDESGSPYWGHAGNGLASALFQTGPVEIRFYGITSNHGRVLHFKTSDLTCWQYFALGYGNDCSGLFYNNSEYPDHTAYLPDAGGDTWGDQGDYAMTSFPFWLWGAYHWGIRGEGYRWEVDDYTGDGSQSTLHRIWVRTQGPKETVCNDGIDDDADSNTDCNDFDCRHTDECQAKGSSCLDIYMRTGKKTGPNAGGPADGLYVINPWGSEEIQVYCDMANGGWTQVMNFPTPTSAAGVTDWNNPTARLGDEFNNLAKPFKFTDEEINLLKTGAYRGNGTASTCFYGPCSLGVTLYWSATCVYHSMQNSPACSTAFWDEALTIPTGNSSPESRHWGLTDVTPSTVGFISSHHGNHVAVGEVTGYNHAFDGRFPENPTIQVWVK